MTRLRPIHRNSPTGTTTYRQVSQDDQQEGDLFTLSTRSYSHCLWSPMLLFIDDLVFALENHALSFLFLHCVLKSDISCNTYIILINSIQQISWKVFLRNSNSRRHLCVEFLFLDVVDPMNRLCYWIAHVSRTLFLWIVNFIAEFFFKYKRLTWRTCMINVMSQYKIWRVYVVL